MRIVFFGVVSDWCRSDMKLSPQCPNVIFISSTSSSCPTWNQDFGKPLPFLRDGSLTRSCPAGLSGFTWTRRPCPDGLLCWGKQWCPGRCVRSCHAIWYMSGCGKNDTMLTSISESAQDPGKSVIEKHLNCDLYLFAFHSYVAFLHCFKTCQINLFYISCSIKC